MARPLVLSNGELHVGINTFGLVHDFYFPYVGLENHSAGHSLRHLVGVWIDGSISWLNNGDWAFTFRYPHAALIGHTLAKNEKIGIILEFDDFVDTGLSAFMRNIHIVNLWNKSRDVRLFMHQAFAIGDSRSNTDTAQYLPDEHAVLHYRGRRAFIVSGMQDGGSFDQYTVGLFGIENHEGSHIDAEDGELGMGNVEHGRVDSVLRFSVHVEPHSSKRVHYWIAAGTSIREVLYVHGELQKDGLLKRLHHTADWWHNWLAPAFDTVQRIPEAHRDNFLRSLMIIKSQIDKRGAVIASTDTTMLNYSRDAYAYCWPRDAALVLWPLVRLGYVQEPLKFFEFCKRVLHPNGYLMHKYQADGALGSSWHPYMHDNGVVGPPIQEDETALVLFMFSQFYAKHPDPQYIHDFYSTMISPMATFLAEYVDADTGLPKPSYNLWEEHYMTSVFTTSTVYAALHAAADLAEIAEDESHAVAWRSAADDIHEAAMKYLYDDTRKVLYKGVRFKGGQVVPDTTIDTSSIFGAFLFGLYPSDSDEIASSVRVAVETFIGDSDSDTFALPRYENDYYRRVSDDISGNWWPITSLWLAQYYIEQDKVSDAMKILDWIKQIMHQSGVISEQINPFTGESVSVAPLTWSHAEYVSTLLDIVPGELRDDA